MPSSVRTTPATGLDCTVDQIYCTVDEIWCTVDEICCTVDGIYCTVGEVDRRSGSAAAQMGVSGIDGARRK